MLSKNYILKYYIRFNSEALKNTTVIFWPDPYIFIKYFFCKQSNQHLIKLPIVSNQRYDWFQIFIWELRLQNGHKNLRIVSVGLIVCKWSVCSHKIEFILSWLTVRICSATNCVTYWCSAGSVTKYQRAARGRGEARTVSSRDVWRDPWWEPARWGLRTHSRGFRSKEHVTYYILHITYHNITYYILNITQNLQITFIARNVCHAGKRALSILLFWSAFFWWFKLQGVVVTSLTRF